MTLQELQSRFRSLPEPRDYGHAVAAQATADMPGHWADGVIEYGQAHGQLAAFGEYIGEFPLSTVLQFKPVLERMLLRAETALRHRTR